MTHETTHPATVVDCEGVIAHAQNELDQSDDIDTRVEASRCIATWNRFLCYATEIERLDANLRAAIDLVAQAEKLIPGFASTFSPVIISDTAAARQRADLAESRLEQAQRENVRLTGILARLRPDIDPATGYGKREGI